MTDIVKKMVGEAMWGGGGTSGGNSGMHVVAIAGVPSTETADEMECHYEKSSIEEALEAVDAGKVVILRYKFNMGGALLTGNTSMMALQQTDDNILGLAFTAILGSNILGFMLNADGSIWFNPSAT